MKTKLHLKLVSVFLLLITSILSAQTFTEGNFTYEIISGTNVKLTGYVTAPTGVLNIPTTVTDGSLSYTVISIGDYAFISCSGLITVSIPNSVISIGDASFASCDGLATLSIGSSVTSIGHYAFFSCISLTTVDIPNSVTSIGDYAFQDCTDLITLNIGNSVTSIGDGAFQDCTDLTMVSIPNSVTSIGYEVFSFCTSLTMVSIPNSVTSIGTYAFEFCTSLTTVSIPNFVTSIGNSAFRNCTGLTAVNVSWATPLVINSTVFQGITLGSIALNVSSPGVVADYQVAAVWKDFSPINELTLSTNSYQANSIVKLYPNPAKDYFSISGLLEQQNYIIYNASGAKVNAASVSSNEKIGTQNLANGTYFLKLENGNSIQFIKQ